MANVRGIVGSVVSEPPRPRPTLPIVIGAIVVVVLLLVAVVVARLARVPEIPSPPIGLEELGSPPATSALDVIVRESSRLAAAPGPDGVHDRFLESRRDDELVLDDALRAAMASLEPTQLLDRSDLVELVYDGTPMLDRCTDLEARCPGIEVVRAAQSVELVVLGRWIAGDREGAVRLLARALVASLELAQSGRSVMSQLVGIASLLRATGLAVMLQRAGLVIEGPLRAAIEPVVDAPVDLGRGWIVEMHRAAHALRTIPPYGIVEQLAFDRPSTARALYVGQEACVRYARDPSAPRPAVLPLPSSEQMLLSSQTELALLNAVLPDCTTMIEAARTRLDRSRVRARALLAQP
jgi:hypothetical protein